MPDGGTQGTRDGLAGADLVWDAAEQSAEVGRWEWDTAAGELRWSANLYRLMGYAPGEVEPTPQSLYERVHPEDAGRVRSAVGTRGTQTRPVEYRVLHPDGSVRHLHSAPAAGNSHDELEVLVGIVRDITEQRAAERDAALHGGVARALAEWSSFRAGGERLLAEMAQALEMSAAGMWLAEGAELQAAVLWAEHGLDRDAFARALRDPRTAPGARLAAGAWERGGPLRADTQAIEQAPAADGIRPAFAVPARGAEAPAVIVLYAPGVPPADTRLLAALDEAGCAVGAFLARRGGALRVPLTARETEVLRHAAHGLAGAEIAGAMQLSAATVKTHLANIYAKLGVSNRVAAVAYALREGLIE
jgi:PAS domain S-box-containing protein